MLSLFLIFVAVALWLIGFVFFTCKLFLEGIVLFLIGFWFLKRVHLFGMMEKRFNDACIRSADEAHNLAPNNSKKQSTTVRKDQPVIQIKLDGEHSNVKIQYDHETGFTHISSE